MRVLSSLLAVLFLASCGGRGEGPLPQKLAQCSYGDVLLIADAAVREGDPHALEEGEAAAVKASLSEQCRGALSETQVPFTIRFSSLKKRTGDRRIKDFLTFVTEGALNKALRRFPLTGAAELVDPKTRRTPALGAPRGTPVKLLIDIDAIADEEVKAAVVAGAAVGDKNAAIVPLKAQGRSINVRLVSIPKPTTIEGVKRVDIRTIGDGNFLIYLPHPYLVATSVSLHRELYPHDSSYVMEALLRRPKERHLGMVRDMLAAFAYELDHFGFVLNGNRGYYLTRSQTNNIPSNVWLYYEAAAKVGRGDARDWLKETGWPLAKGVYDYWQSGDGVLKLGEGLSGNRWQAHGAGPAQEVWESHAAHKAYYFRVLDSLAALASTSKDDLMPYQKGFDYSRAVKPLDAKLVKYVRNAGLIRGSQGMVGRMYILPGAHTASGKDEPVIRGAKGDERSYYAFTPAYYVDDRASRASGYDSNHLYGPFNAYTRDFVAVALNVQLYRHERDMAKMMRALGRDEEVHQWDVKALERKKMILATLWDDEAGMLFDYDVRTKQRHTSYPFTCSAYALWAKLFNVREVSERTMLLRLVAYVAKHLEGPDGLYASGVETGLHWDKPYCWPIHQGMVVWGLRYYADELKRGGLGDESAGLSAMADRIALKYLKANYRLWMRSKGQEIPEKVGPDEGVTAGYESGANYTWNLAAVWDLYDGLSEKARDNFHAYAALLERNAAAAKRDVDR